MHLISIYSSPAIYLLYFYNLAPTNRDMLKRNTISFFSQWMKSPRSVGSVVPSSPFLAKKMAKQINIDTPGMIIELGGGTGSLTRVLLHYIPPERLIVIESNQHLVNILRDSFPDVRILHTNAMQLGRALKDNGITDVNAIVSGLPLLSIKTSTRHKILAASFSQLRPGRQFLQFTYGPKSPVSKAIITKYDLDAKVVASSWLNIPPARIWAYRKKNTPES